MARILRTSLFRSKYFGQNAAGLFESILGCQTSNSITQSLLFNSFPSPLMNNKSAHIDKVYKDMATEPKRVFRPNRFEIINFSPIYEPNVHEQTLVTVFMKMCNAYKGHQNEYQLSRNLRHFLQSSQFADFCSVLSKKLPEFSASSLLPLLELHYFWTRESERLLERVQQLILEYINDFTILEKLHLYNRLNRGNFHSSKTSKEIIMLLDKYLEVCFANDIYRVRNRNDLLHLLSMEFLPSYLKKGIVTRLIDESLDLTKAGSGETFKLILRLCEGNNYKAAKREKMIELIKRFIFLSSSSMSCSGVVKAYSRIVSNDASNFDESVMKFILDFYCDKFHNPSHKIQAFLNLCLMGYWDEQVIRMVYDFIVGEANHNFPSISAAASILLRYSGEILSKDELGNVLGVFSGVNFEKSTFFGRCEWCASLMCLGHDVKDMLNDIFLMDRRDSQDEIHGTECPISPLTLYHQARALGYELPSKDVAENMLKAEFSNLFSTDLDLKEYFETDNVIKGCTTSDHHCLHFVAAFAPDGSTLDLSPYRKKPPVRTKLEDIVVPPEYKLIVFQIYPDLQPLEYRNVPKPSGVYKFIMNSFQGLNCNFVPLTLPFLRSNAEERRMFLEKEVYKVLWKTE